LAENKNITWWIICLLQLHFFAEVSAKTLIPVSGKDQYVAFSAMESIFPELHLALDKVTGVGRISVKDKELRFKTGSSFYTQGMKIEKISLPVLYKKKQVYLPPDIVEAVFLHLIEKEVSYIFTSKYLELEKKNRIAAKTSLKYIIIDAGHGGKDPGTSEPGGATQEKQITLEVALVLQKMLKQRLPQVETILTRDNDTFISLEKRAEIANMILKKNQDSVYISLHCNATMSPEPNGYEVYYFSQNASTEKARELALIENQVVGKKYSDPVSLIQADMMSSLIQRQSRMLAESMDLSLEKEIGSKIQKRGIKKADFAVLRGSLMPAVLIEIGYLSNKNDAFYLKNKQMQETISKSVIQGIVSYARKINI